MNKIDNTKLSLNSEAGIWIFDIPNIEKDRQFSKYMKAIIVSIWGKKYFSLRETQTELNALLR